jgi:hypothetical protein
MSPHRPAAIDLLPYPIDASWAPFMPVSFENRRRSAGTGSIVPGRGGAGAYGSISCPYRLLTLSCESRFKLKKDSFAFVNHLVASKPNVTFFGTESLSSPFQQ